MPSKIAHPEDSIQEAVVAQVRARGAPGLVFWHNVNSSKLGGKRTSNGIPLEAIRLKRLGLRAGVSDLIFLHAADVFLLEIKAERGRLTDEQDQFLIDAESAGASVAVAVGLDAAIRQLECWGLLRGRMN